MSDGALSIAVAALQQIAQLGSEERDRVTAQAALDCIDGLGEAPQKCLAEFVSSLYSASPRVFKCELRLGHPGEWHQQTFEAFPTQWRDEDSSAAVREQEA